MNTSVSSSYIQRLVYFNIKHVPLPKIFRNLVSDFKRLFLNKKKRNRKRKNSKRTENISLVKKKREYALSRVYVRNLVHAINPQYTYNTVYALRLEYAYNKIYILRPEYAPTQSIYNSEYIPVVSITSVQNISPKMSISLPKPKRKL